jgi:hypothetical protein
MTCQILRSEVDDELVSFGSIGSSTDLAPQVNLTERRLACRSVSTARTS